MSNLALMRTLTVGCKVHVGQISPRSEIKHVKLFDCIFGVVTKYL